MIRQIVDGTEYYLKEIGKYKVKDSIFSSDFANKTKRKKKKQEEPEKEDNINETATWTPDDTKAMVFHSLREAEAVIRKWHILRYGTIIRV